MKNKIMRAVSLCMIMVFALLSVSCASPSGTENSEIIEAAKKLLPEASKINAYIWGEVSGYDDTAEPVKDANGSKYYPLGETFPYKSIDEIKAAVALVYSENYTNTICSTLTGFDDEVLGYVSSRYLEENGKLYVNTGASSYNTDYEYLLDTVSVTKNEASTVAVNVKYKGADGEGNIDIIMVREADGWRFDSAT